MNPTHFACVWTGQKYRLEYVQKLHRAIHRNFSGPFTFTVFTNNPISDAFLHHRAVIVPPGAVGYWNKLFLFARGRDGHGHWPKGERVVYFDLDVLICGSLDWLLDWPSERLWMARDSIRPDRWNSSMMMWPSGSDYTAPIWSRWVDTGRPIDKQMPHSKGDQAWIEAYCRSTGESPWLWQQHIPLGRVDFYYRPRPGSKKWDTLTRIPPGTSVVIFHGKPHFTELQHTIPWVEEHWR